VNDPTIPAVQAMLLLAIVMLAGVIAAGGCAGPRYQPPGGGLSAIVTHVEAERKP
jgi:predicted small lipoprotein YifL